jgi:histidinol-phosphatase (PHP family)
MILYDTHVHTEFSTDSQTPLSDQLDAAVSHGLKGICLTDHMDYEFPKEQYGDFASGSSAPFVFDLTEYTDAIQRFRPRYPKLEIYTGVECGLQLLPKVIEKNTLLAERDDLDYLIGSLHLADGKDPYYPSFWENRNPSVCVRHYFELVYDNITQFHSFDSLGHLDYIVRYAPDTFVYRPEEYQDIIMEILRFLVQHDIALEVNTSGWKSSSFSNPHPSVLEWYRELGGYLVTIGSDAHAAEYLGFSFEKAAKLLQNVHIEEYVTFQRHRPVFHKISSSAFSEDC